MKPTNLPWYTEYLVRKMHPDLYTDIPESQECKDYRKRQEFISGLLAMANLLEDTDIPLPTTTWFYGDKLSFSTHDVKARVNGEKYGEMDKEGTQELLGTIAKAMKPVAKEYQDGKFILVKDLGNGWVYKVTSPREAVCTKKVVEKKYIPPYTSPGHYQDVVEWDCDPISLLEA